MPAGSALDFQVSLAGLEHHRFVPAPAPNPADLRPGEALLAIDRFAFTANNITYAVFGDEMGYWRFFPGPNGWGRIPVWGFAEVAASRADGLASGERVFGFLPMSTHLTVAVERLGAGAFIDDAGHRRALPAVYNQYLRCAADPGYRIEHEALQMLFRPLFMTSFLIDDFLADNDFFGADAVVISSASAKTAFGLAHRLASRRDRRVIGLTSSGNVAFVRGLECYHRVVEYAEIGSLADEGSAVFVDIAGNAEVRRTVHRQFGDELKYSCAVGGAHWDKRGPAGPLPGAAPRFFFAPAQVEKRSRDWGPGGLKTRFAEAWNAFLVPAAGWIEVVNGRGRPAIESVYTAMLEGKARPDQGHILSF